MAAVAQAVGVGLAELCFRLVGRADAARDATGRRTDGRAAARIAERRADRRTARRTDESAADRAARALSDGVAAGRLRENPAFLEIAAEVLRLNVGSAKAARIAVAGTASMSARSELPISTLESIAVRASVSGTDRCRCSRWPRQRHSVHNASGQAGHRNQAHWRAIERAASRSSGCPRQRHAPHAVASTAASTVAPSTHGA